MKESSAVPNVDRFLGQRAAMTPSGLTVRSHLDGLPSEELLETLGRPHRTSFYFLLFVVRGSVSYSVDFKDHLIAQNEVLFVKPWQVRTPPVTKNEAEFYKLVFGPEVVSRLSRHRFWLDPLNTPVVSFSELAAKRLERLVKTLKETVDEVPSNLVWDYLNLVCSEIENQYFEGMPVQTPGEDYGDFQRLQGLVEDLYNKGPTMPQLAKLLGVSRAKLYQITKAWTGLSPKGYVNQRIIVETQRLLLYVGLPVKELASRLGFRDENYFSRFFREQTGESISQFLARQGNLSRK